MLSKTLGFMSSLFFVLFAGGVFANNIKYDYAELRYFTGEIDDVDFDGLNIGGSYRVNNDIFILGHFSDLSADDTDTDATTLQFGAGYIYPLSPTIDLASSVSILRVEVEAGGLNADETGFELATELRTMVSAIPHLEFRGTLAYVDLDDSDLQLRVAGDYHVNQQFAIGLELHLAGDVDGLSIGGRYYF